MATLSELFQRNPNENQDYRDALSRYREIASNVRMEKDDNVTRADREKTQEQYVPLSTFLAFRSDIYLYISQMADLTRSGLEELQKILNSQSKDTETLRKYEMEKDESNLEKGPGLLERSYDSVKETVKNNKGTIAGLFGLLALAGFMSINPQQFEEFGQGIDELISTVRDGLLTAAGVLAAAEAARRVFNRTTGRTSAPSAGGGSGTTGNRGSSSGASGGSSAAGPSGRPGTSGIPGTAGTSGSTGGMGVPGAAGQRGTAGSAGPAGTSGTSGQRGTTGTAGGAGSPGRAGADGSATRGAAGVTGARGTPGAPGATARQLIPGQRAIGPRVEPRLLPETNRPSSGSRGTIVWNERANRFQDTSRPRSPFITFREAASRGFYPPTGTPERTSSRTGSRVAPAIPPEAASRPSMVSRIAGMVTNRPGGFLRSASSSPVGQAISRTFSGVMTATYVISQASEINSLRQQFNSGLITREQYRAGIARIVGETAGGVLGSALGSRGGFLASMLGGFGGHILGGRAGSLIERTPIPGIVDRVYQILNETPQSIEERNAAQREVERIQSGGPIRTPAEQARREAQNQGRMALPERSGSREEIMRTITQAREQGVISREEAVRLTQQTRVRGGPGAVNTEDVIRSLRERMNPDMANPAPPTMLNPIVVPAQPRPQANRPSPQQNTPPPIGMQARNLEEALIDALTRTVRN